MESTIIKELDADSGVASPEVSPDNSSEEGKKCVTPVKKEKKMAVATIDPEDFDDEDDFDETLAERLWGLTEMFPESLQNATSKLSRGAVYLLKNGYHYARQVVWVGVSTSVILFAPVMLEVERYNLEEMVKQDRNRLVLGPGSTGSPGMPPPISR